MLLPASCTLATNRECRYSEPYRPASSGKRIAYLTTCFFCHSRAIGSSPEFPRNQLIMIVLGQERGFIPSFLLSLTTALLPTWN